MATSCTVDCTVNASNHIDIESDHPLIEVISASELKFSLDIENGETVAFTVPDFTHAGTDYTVVVTSTSAGSSAPTVWSRAGSSCVSPTYGREVNLDIDIVATESTGSGQVTGGGIIRIRTKGKPDL